MSKVKIQGNASGTGVLTITAPNTSTDRTITLPDTTGTLLDENSSVPAANLTGTVADARISTLTASKLTGALPAVSGASLTGLTSSQMPSGSIVQFASDFDGAYINLNTTSWVNTALSISFTPKFSDSIIIAQAIVNMYTVGASTTHGNTRYQILKDGSDYGEEFNIYSGYGGTEALVVGPMPAYYAATSGSTSAQTYTVRVRNPQSPSGGSHNQYSGLSSLFLWEVKA